METAPPGAKEVSRTFPSCLEALEELLDWLEQIRFPNIPDALWVQAQTALVEGFTNAVRHAHAALDPPPPVGVVVYRSASVLEIRVVDSGAPFQLRAEEPQPDRESHWGLILLQRLQEQYQWSIAYEPTMPEGSPGNVLRIRHALDQAPPLLSPDP